MVSLLRGCYLESLVGAFLRSSFGAKQTLHFNPPCLRPSESAVCVSGSCDELTCVIDLCFCSFQVRQRVSEQTVPDMVTTNRCFSIPYKFNQKENISEKYPGICTVCACVHKFCKTASFCEIVTGLLLPLRSKINKFQFFTFMYRTYITHHIFQHKSISLQTIARIKRVKSYIP
jgi:hypothetical protein